MMRYSVLAMLLCVAAVQVAERQWQLEREEDGVSVYQADVPVSKYKAYRGVVAINADLAGIQAAQEDVAGPAPESSAASSSDCSRPRVM